jgi:hypothetical protein
MYEPVIGEGKSAGVRLSRHDSPPDRVNSKAKPEYFEGIALLPACRATNVVYVYPMIGVAQNAGAIVHGFGIEEEMVCSGDGKCRRQPAHITIVVGA